MQSCNKESQIVYMEGKCKAKFRQFGGLWVLRSVLTYN